MNSLKQTNRIRRGLVALCFVFLPIIGSAQVGRLFVTAEAYAGLSRGIHVGKILEIEQIEYNEPLTKTQKIGKPHRLTFEVNETIRGEEAERLNLVLSLQSTHFLEFMRDHSIEIMLVSCPERLTRFPGAEIGIEEQGRRVDGDWYHFRVLSPVEPAEAADEYTVEIAAQLNNGYDFCQMFTVEFEVIVGREAILKRVRAFAKKYPDMLKSVMVVVPNEFGAKVGDPNAYCGITLPICSESKATLVAINDDPNIVMRQIESRNEEFDRSQLLKETEKALAKFLADDVR